MTVIVRLPQIYDKGDIYVNADHILKFEWREHSADESYTFMWLTTGETIHVAAKPEMIQLAIMRTQ